MISYALEPDLSVEEFTAVLTASTLAERRPVNDAARIERMLREADVIVTARRDGKLVGVSRAITDFSFCCYLSDLAVDETFQKQGIGKELIAQTHKEAGTQTTLILIAAPAAEKYYTKIGMEPAPCYVIKKTS